MAYGTVWRAGAAGALGLCVAIGCGGGGNAGAGGDKAASPANVRSTVIEHEPCKESGRVEVLDVNNDSKPDIKKIYDGQLEVCRVSDLNRDGHPDLYEYFDKSGQLRRREFDFDDNGVINQIDVHEGGKLVRRDMDATNQGRIDTWDSFDPMTGKLAKRERDTTGDGRVDQWWTYETDRVTIAMDRNGDGLPDPEATMLLGPDGKPISLTDAGAASPVATGAEASAAAPPPPPSPPSPPAEPSSPLSISDAGVAGKPQRGGAKR